jgi:hypothetical protein
MGGESEWQARSPKAEEFFARRKEKVQVEEER